jgi:hypothetical protein
VRKACVEIVVSISEMIDPQARESTLTNQMLAFLEDSNKWVNVAAKKQLGPYIYTFSQGGNLVTKLIERFCNLLETLDYDPCTNNEVNYMKRLIYVIPYTLNIFILKSF